MDPVENPFSPGAGAPLPELVGRQAILEQARILLARIKAKRPEKSILFTGLRGDCEFGGGVHVQLGGVIQLPSAFSINNQREMEPLLLD